MVGNFSDPVAPATAPPGRIYEVQTTLEFVISPSPALDNRYVTQFAMYIEGHAPRIQFLTGAAGTAVGVPVHTIQTDGIYRWNSLTNPTLQIFAIPNVILGSVVRVSITNMSTTNPIVRVWGVEGNALSFRVWHSATPLELFNNTVTDFFQTTNTLAMHNTIHNNAADPPTLIAMLNYNSNPFYAVIPSISFLNTTTGTAVPITTLQFSLTVSSGTNLLVTSAFTLDATLTYTNIRIPLTPNPIFQVPQTGLTYGQVTPSTTVPFLNGTIGIVPRLACLNSPLPTNIRIALNNNNNNGMIIQLHGTGITINPAFNPETLSIVSPITFANQKIVNFSAITNTQTTAGGPMMYTLLTDDNRFGAGNVVASIPLQTAPSFRLANAATVPNGASTITFYANSDTLNASSNGFHTRSIFAQPRVMDYKTLAAGTVVPFVNLGNVAIPNPISLIDASMFVNFTQNVTMNSLNFGYMFPEFMPSSAGIANGGYIVATNLTAPTVITFTVESIPSTPIEPVINYGRVALTVMPSETPLYNFTSFTFTDGGRTGPSGPTLDELRTHTPAYNATSTPWTQTYLTMNTRGIQEWIVPTTGFYDITAASPGYTGTVQNGLSLNARAALTRGERIFILVGQLGSDVTSGSGGTFVVRGSLPNPSPIVVAGGPGGRGRDNTSTSSNGQINDASAGDGAGDGGAGGTGSGGGNPSSWGTGGGGLIGNGGNTVNRNGGAAFSNGGATLPGTGGFGGGGSTENGWGGGGGGGMNGGGGGGMIAGLGQSGGGGGSSSVGSYLIGSQTTTSRGYVIIQLLSPAHIAMHTETNNGNGSNDGTLVSVPFTTSGMTPLPTHVSVFTPATLGSQFVFNTGDQVRIRMTTATAGPMSLHGSIVWTTRNGGSELAGALMCTPVSGPAAAVPEVVSAGFGSRQLVTRTAAITSQSMSSKTILTGYRLNGILIAAAQQLSPVVNVQVDIWNGSTETDAPILQVFFTYIETTPTPTAPTPFRIPFSYAEYARDALSSRINPRTLVYNGPQNPIFNVDNTFRMRITVNAVNADMTIVTNANGTDIAGQFWGIRLTTPTITFPTLQMGEGAGGIRPGVTPVFVGIPTNPFVTSAPARDIPISIPTTNSTGAFTYTVTSQSVNPPAASGSPAPSISTIANNAFTAQFANNIHSRFLINAWQRSSTSFTNGLATSTIDYINTSGTFGAYSTSPSVSSGVQQIQMINNPRPFVACIMENSAALHGFSFQFFGGYQGGAMNYTMRVWVTRGNVRQTHELIITFTTSVGTTNRGLLDGTFAYIPFQQNVIQTPTHVSNVVYTGSLPTVQLGDFVRVSLTGINSGNMANIQTTPLQTISAGNQAGPMMGSLLIDTMTGIPPIVEGQGALDMQNNGIVINANSSVLVLNTTIGIANILALQYIRLPMIELVSPTSPPLPPPTVTSPHRMRVTIAVANGQISVYTCEIVICIIAQQTSSGLINIPFNMRMPALGDSTPGFFVESFNPTFNTDFFNINSPTPETSTATHSFPLILPGTYSYAVSVANMESSRQAILRQTLVLGTNISCTLGYIILPNT